MRNKAQAVITDLFIALFIFLLLVSTIIFIWNRYSTRFNEDLEYKDMQLKALEISDLLIKTQGYPENWELDPSSVDILGLASSDRVLSEEKINALILNITYQNATMFLGLPTYDFYLRLSYLNGTMIQDYGLSSTSELSVSVKRIVSYKNEKVIFETRIWK